MARQKGMLNLSGNLEPLAGAPLDSRSITPTVADLYIASNWPYKYIGMKTTVTATGDTYRLVNLDVTQESSWVKEGGESGQTIQYDELPAASSSLAGKIYQYTGTTNLQYTNGYFYECVNDGGTYKWVQTNTQPWTSYNDFTGATEQTAGAHGLVPAPTTGDISKFLKGDGTWATVPIQTIGIGGGFAPIGTIISYMGTTAPQDYLICDGTTYNIADYKQLSDFFASQFGSANFFGGDGVTTFKVPDLRGEFLRGTGTNSHEGCGNGANVGVHQNGTRIPYAEVSDNYLGLRKSSKSQTEVTYSDAQTMTSEKWANINFSTSGTYAGGMQYSVRTTNTSVLYCIKAVVAGDVYSTTERVVGTWIDGKPVYEKIIDCGTISGSSDIEINHNITGIDNVVSISGILKELSGLFDPLPYATPAGINVLFRLAINATKIILTKGNVIPDGGSAYVTVRYTKTIT